MTETEPLAATEQLTVPQCWTLLRSTPLGRLATVVDGRPDIHPVNHLVDHGTVLFRTADGTKLRAAVGHEVAFEADGYDADLGRAWSVVDKGTAREISELDESLGVMILPLFPWQAGPKPRYVRIEPASVTGRRFVVSGGMRPATVLPVAGSSIVVT
jgi:nitroimidazol reductase NimA-like FMN-containing flavoprotein (pyridoxamine 5'-phosphate oxidase superfamily)